MRPTLQHSAEQNMANAYMTIIRSQSRRVKQLLLYAITEDLKEETSAKPTASQSEWRMGDLRGIVSNNVSDKDARDEYLSGKYGL